MYPEREKHLKNIINKMNKINVLPLPVTKYLIKCFNVAMEDEEVKFLNKIDVISYSKDALLKISDLDNNSFSMFLEKILHKGFLYCIEDNSKSMQYTISPIMVGWFEVYLSSGDECKSKKLFAKSLEKYSESRKFLTHFPVRNIFNMMIKTKLRPFTEVADTFKEDNKRTIVLNKEISFDDFSIIPSEKLNNIINKYAKNNQLAVMHCFCRQWKKMVNQQCKFKHDNESCIIIGSAVDILSNAGVGRRIDKEECLEIVKNASKKGAIHQVFKNVIVNDKAEMAICNCCWDCCVMLGAFNRGLGHILLKSCYSAELAKSQNACILCGKCEKYCPTNAIKSINEKIVLDSAKCIGCGQCRLKCPKNLFTLIKIEREVFIPMQKKSNVRIK
ncbi:MAG: 4Fe-4S dicluster domain-containing protein [bacterium]|nr:4Fe-4S dicluster domain-containing protein [bacterium]